MNDKIRLLALMGMALAANAFDEQGKHRKQTCESIPKPVKEPNKRLLQQLTQQHESRKKKRKPH